INIPIFDPSLKAAVHVNEAKARLAEEEYRKTVLVAYAEVENALTNLASRKRQLQTLESQVRDLETVSEQIRAQVKIGLVSQLEVFEAQRRLLAVQLQGLAVRQQLLSDTVTLYKALGGGWPPELVSKTVQE
ncbi:MAG TPA: TolC family protein, partial [Nitrococcus sp.]|nr:TolC family protein [Nitrococcus sp.]